MQTLIRSSFYSVLQKRLIINSESELEYVDPRIQLPFLRTLHTYTVYLHILPNILPVENFRKACMKCRLCKISDGRRCGNILSCHQCCGSGPLRIRIRIPNTDPDPDR